MPMLSISTLTKVRIRIIAVILLLLAVGATQLAEASAPVVRVILFFSPTCPHCARVKEEVLPPLFARYGSQLQIATVDTTTQTGYALFLSACMQHGLLRLSVPLLIVGDNALVGDTDIPQKFPGLIEKYLASGGVDWPKIQGLDALLASNPGFSEGAQPAAATETAAAASTPAVAENRSQAKPSAAAAAKAAEAKLPEASKVSTAPVSRQAPKSHPEIPEHAGLAPKSSATATIPAPPKTEPASSAETPHSPKAPTQPPGMIDLTRDAAKLGVIDRIKRDIYGNGLAILVLAGMVLTLCVFPLILRKAAALPNLSVKPRYDWLIPILTIAGLGVASYLSNVEVRKVEAVCGPVGDCNTVNQSAYAKLFGVLPIGVLGFIGFLAILAAWALRRWGTPRISRWAAVAILGMTGFGLLFSIYLTFLEPFVIGATCLWCLSSAVIMTTLFWLALKPGRKAWSDLAQSKQRDE